jgi:hypothetical protein
MAVKKRCPFCHKHTRADGTCQTEGCPLYVPEVTEEEKPQEQTDGNDEN